MVFGNIFAFSLVVFFVHAAISFDFFCFWNFVGSVF